MEEYPEGTLSVGIGWYQLEASKFWRYILF